VTGTASGASGAPEAAPYAFGDTDRAARRLALVAEVFEPPTRRLLEDGAGALAAGAARRDRTATAGAVDLAVDLGCGPGHTTRLLAETIRPRRAVGLDSSPAFVDLARRDQERRARARRPAGALAEPAFIVHDVTRTPFPTGPADLLLCRFLLSHLPSPGETVAAWATQLRPGGIVLVDEVDWIDPRDPTLRDYLAAVDAVLAHQGHRLEVGPVLDALPAPAGLDRLVSRVVTLDPPAAQAAEMFAMNLRVWRTHPYARSNLGDAELDRLAAGLDALVSSPGDASITWGMRQIVYHRPA
jgi:trans-aconitate 2-methyltransferase